MPITDFFRMQKNFGDYGGAMDAPDSGGISGMDPRYRNPNQPDDYFAGTRDQSPPEPPESLSAPAESQDDDSFNNMDLTPIVNDYSRQSRDTDALRELSNQYPDREKYKPSVLRQIGSAFIGYDQGYGAQQHFKDAPYDEAVADWKNRLAPAENLANLERYGNTDATRGILGQGNLAIRSGNLERQNRQGDERNNIAWAKVDLSQQRIDQNQEKIDHLNERQDLTDSEKEALRQRYKLEQIAAKGELDKAKQQLVGSQKLGQIGAKGAVDKDVQELRNKGSLATQGLRNTGAAATRATVPGGAGATSQLPSQQRTALQNRAGQAKREHPEWSNYIKVDASGQVTVTPPGSSFGIATGPDKKTYDAINTYLKGSGATGGDSAKAVGMIEMWTPDAKGTRMVSPKDVQTAIEQGYTYK